MMPTDPQTAPPGSAAANDERARADVITAAASDLLEEGGLEGLTVRAVLRRTGLARRAFYESFAGKDDLVLAVFERTLKDASERFREQVRGFADPVERIRAIVAGIILGRLLAPGADGIAGADRRGAALSREHLRLAEARPRELDAALAPLLALIAELVAEGIAAGGLRECDPALQARLIYNLVSTTAQIELLTHEGPLDRERRVLLLDHIWEFCRRAIVR
ncbi:MAG: TetR family transcriptional regulator [Novosphingobium sp.]